ncbi:MlaD family protein [Campylobacter sp. MOP7]|uniref:MlaD family protein n=1 Tax=Campylobacter canis TaxID=3378588 RepID=UPI00387E59F9
MGNRVNYTLVGLFFVAVVTSIGGFMWWMGSYGESKDAYRSYYILTTDLPNGIKKDSQVKFIGVDAGIVKNIKFADPKEAMIEVELLVRKELPIKKDSTAIAESQGITGISYLNIQRGSHQSEIFSENEKAYIKLEASLLEKIGGKANDLTQRIEDTLSKVNRVLNEENIDKVSSILNSIDSITKEIDEQNIDINETIKLANEAILDFKRLIKASSKTVEAINFIPDKIGSGVGEFKNLQVLIQDRIKNGEFDFKTTLNSLSSEVSETMIEFQKALKEFRQTLFRLEDRPYEFFFKDPKEDKDKR